MTMKLRCGECGERKFEQKNVKGQFSTPWRDFPRAFLTQDLHLPVCGNCGNYAIEGDEAEQLDAAIEASVRDQASQFIEVIKAKANITGVKLAKLVGVTPEYLSMLSNHKNTPSYQVWNMLKLIANDPKKLTAELDPDWDIRKKNLLLRA
jgi:DNA-binding transcriptional regulator YiaG